MKKINELKKKKEALIREYLSLQDQADRMNEKIYEVTCEIEGLNLLIHQEEKKKLKKKQASKKPAPSTN